MGEEADADAAFDGEAESDIGLPGIPAQPQEAGNTRITTL